MFEADKSCLSTEKITLCDAKCIAVTVNPKKSAFLKTQLEISLAYPLHEQGCLLNVRNIQVESNHRCLGLISRGICTLQPHLTHSKMCIK